MQYASTSAMRSATAAGEAQVVERHLVDREEAAGRAVLGRHVPDRRAVGERQPRQSFAVVLDELADDAGLAEHLGHGQDEVGRGRAVRQRAAELEPDDLWDEHRERLSEHRGLGLDPARAPAEHAEAVDHRRMRIGADERVRERDAVTVFDDTREVLEVHLVADAGAGRDDLEVPERLLAPAKEEVALMVALELELDVASEGDPRGERIDLDRMVDHELDRDQWIDLRRLAAEIRHRVSHRGKVDDCRHACQVLEQHPRRCERDLLRRRCCRVPVRDCRGIVLRALPQNVLEQDTQRVGQLRDVVTVDAEDLVRTISDLEL